jgi:hypothetical protein
LFKQFISWPQLNPAGSQHLITDLEAVEDDLVLRLFRDGSLVENLKAETCALARNVGSRFGLSCRDAARDRDDEDESIGSLPAKR